MIQASANLKALLASGNFIMADLFAFTLLDGTILRYTSLDVPVLLGADLYTSLGIERGTIHRTVGLQVDTMDLTIYPTQNDAVSNGLSLVQYLQGGAFDDALLTLQRAFFSPTIASYPVAVPTDQTVLLFLGRVNFEQIGRSQATGKVSSLTELLNMQLPRNIYTPQCQYELGDVACLVNKDNFSTTGTVEAGSTRSLIKCNTLPANGSLPNIAGQAVITEYPNHLGGYTFLDAQEIVDGNIGYPGVAGSARAGYGIRFSFSETKLINQISMFPATNYTTYDVYFDGVKQFNLYRSVSGATDYSAITHLLLTPLPAKVIDFLSTQSFGVWYNTISEIQIIDATGYQNIPFDRGTILFTSGSNAGVKKTVKRYDGAGNIVLANPLPYTPQTNDSFILYQGCDKSLDTCIKKFSNYSRFRGCPFVPVPEAST